MDGAPAAGETARPRLGELCWMGRLGSFQGAVLSLGRELSEEGVSPGVYSRSLSFSPATAAKCR